MIKKKIMEVFMPMSLLNKAHQIGAVDVMLHKLLTLVCQDSQQESETIL